MVEKKLCYSKLRCVLPITGGSLRQPRLGFLDQPAWRLELLKKSESQLFCTNCGKNLEGSQAGFCPDCGTPALVVQDQLRDPLPVNSGASGSASLMVPWRGGQVAWGLTFLVVGVSILLLLLAIILLSTGDLSQAMGFIGDLNLALAASASSVVLGLVIILIVWYLGLRPTGGSVALLGLRATSIPAGKAILWTFVALALSLGATALYDFLIKGIGVDWLRPEEISSDIIFDGPAGVFSFMALALWTPLTEELFFRGFVFAGLVNRCGVPGAMFFSAIIFSAFHIQPGVLIPIFITGLLLAWLYHHTGSLWPSILAHAGQNSAALLLTIYAPSLSLSSF